MSEKEVREDWPADKFIKQPDGSYLCRDCELRVFKLEDGDKHPCEAYAKILQDKKQAAPTPAPNPVPKAKTFEEKSREWGFA
jgi:hypothetical protein